MHYINRKYFSYLGFRILAVKHEGVRCRINTVKRVHVFLEHLEMVFIYHRVLGLQVSPRDIVAGLLKLQSGERFGHCGHNV